MWRKQGDFEWENQGRHRRNFERSRTGDSLETLGELWEIHGFEMGNRREI
jgi:hypothetical protein